MNTSPIPEGFNLFPEDGSFQDTIAPLYMKLTDEGIIYGLRVEKQHCNSIGICHGAVYMAMMDLALITSVCEAMGNYQGSPTININLNYLKACKEGDWIETRIDKAQLTSSIGFANGKIVIDNCTAVEASGCFKLPRNNDKGVPVDDIKKIAGV